MDELNDLYQEMILDHGRRPRNFHALQSYSHLRVGHNPLCGDELTLFLEIDPDQKLIKKVSFQGQGCAIFMASSSLMTEVLREKTLEEAEKLFEKVHELLMGKLSPEDLENLGKLQVLKGVNEFPVRVKCAALAWRTLEAVLKNQATEEEITTE
jgi:nitrogen fixation protein NifU and related proteins